MGRRSSFADGDVYDAVAREMAPGGMFAIKAVSDRCGVSVGSLYHRYGSREGLLAAACLDAVTCFFDPFVETLAPRDLAAGRKAAAFVPEFCRDNRARATVLLHNSPSNLRAAKAPEDITDDIFRRAAVFDAAILEFGEATGCGGDVARLAVFELPLAIVRHYLPRRAVPAEAIEHAVACYDGMIRS